MGLAEGVLSISSHRHSLGLGIQGVDAICPILCWFASCIKQSCVTFRAADGFIASNSMYWVTILLGGAQRTGVAEQDVSI